MKTASMMLSWAMRAAAFSLVRNDPCAVEQSTTSLSSASGDVCVIGERDHASPGWLARSGPTRCRPSFVPECEKATTTSPCASSDADIAIMCVSSKHRSPNADAKELVRHVAGDLRRAAEAVEVALTAAMQIRSAALSKASMSRIASVSSSAWIEVRNTFWTMVAAVSSGVTS